MLKTDYNVYKNHVYRIYNYTVLLDDDTTNYEKYAIAGVFHDLGIWTHFFDYFKPSIQLAKEYLTKINKQDCIEEIAVHSLDNHGCFCLSSLVQGLSKDLKMKLLASNVPSTLIWGSKDVSHKKTDCNSINEHLLNCKIVEFKDCGHFPELEKTIEYVSLINETLK